MPTDFSLHLGMEEEQFPQGFSFSALRQKLAGHKKAVTVFWAVIILVTVLLGSLDFVASALWARLLQLAGFLGLGFFYLSVLQGSLAELTHTERAVYSAFVGAGVLLVLCSFYFFTTRFQFLSVLANACAALLPYTINDMWRLYNSVSDESPFPHWYYTPQLSHQQATVFLNSLPIRVKVQIDQHGRVEHFIAFRAPVKMKLGTIFYHMVQEQNENHQLSIDFTDSAANPFGWVFFTKSFGWVKFLNPEASLIENGIKPNAVIMARRVTARSAAITTELEKQTV